MVCLKLINFLLFFPASLGLLFHSFTLNILSDQLISFAFFLFSLEQARMAVIDLKPCLFKENMENELQYSSFYIVIIVTLVIELFGFYLALFSLGWGAIFVLISQLWFNFFSPVKVIEQENIKIQNYAFSDKIIILFADVIALILMTLWLINFYPLTIAFIMLGFTMIFGIIKYSPFLLSEQ